MKRVSELYAHKLNWSHVGPLLALCVATAVLVLGCPSSSAGTGPSSGPPTTPTGLTATANPTAGTLTVTWTAVSNATSYALYDTLDGSTPTSANYKDTFSASQPSVTVSGALYGFTYKFAVYATNSSGQSPSSSVTTGVLPDTPTSDGLTTGIHQAIPQADLTSLKTLGMPVNTGSTPPNLQGIWLITPLLLTATSVPNDPYSPGSQFADYYFRLYNQNTTNSTIQLDDAQPQAGETDSGLGGYVVGANNNFTVLIPSTSIIGGLPTSSIIVISGTLQANGIANPYVSLYMVNNNGNPSAIPNNTGRVLDDGVGLAAPQSTFP